MKKYILLLLFISTGLFIRAQDKQVLLESVAGNYVGETKNGLAHGEGVAKGTDTYTGKFKNGLPHGKGKYTWANGDIYQGNFNKGKKNGKGTLTIFKEGKEITVKGIWKADEFVKEIVPPAYKVLRSTNISRNTVIKQSKDGNQVVVSILQNGTVNTAIENLTISGSSGSEFTNGSFTGYENVTFPFILLVKYRAWNQMRTSQFDCTFEIEFYEPGYFKVNLNN